MTQQGISSRIVPRQERALNRLLHRQLHDAATKEKREGTRKTAGPEGETPPAVDPKTGAAPRLAHADPAPDTQDPPRPPSKGDGKGEKAGAPSKAYPAGKRLTPTEIKRSIAQAPEDPKSKAPICWDAACHIGCFRQSCPHSHEPLPPMSKLDLPWPCR